MATFNTKKLMVSLLAGLNALLVAEILKRPCGAKN